MLALFEYLNAPAASTVRMPCSATPSLKLSGKQWDRALRLSRRRHPPSGYVARPGLQN